MLYGERYVRDSSREEYIAECKGEDKYELEKSNMKEPTDQQLKQCLAKMLPEKIFNYGQWGFSWINERVTFDSQESRPRHVLDTELLHICWLIEQTLGDWSMPMQDETPMYRYWDLLCENDDCAIHASWQQRTIALAKVKGVEIV